MIAIKSLDDLAISFISQPSTAGGASKNFVVTL